MFIARTPSVGTKELKDYLPEGDQQNYILSVFQTVQRKPTYVQQRLVAMLVFGP